MVGMIIVNDPGSWSYIYAPLEHAEWHGCTPTDLVFPFFLFIVGVAISLSLQKARYETAHHSSRIWHIAKRSMILFAIGLFLNIFPVFDIVNIRIPGVLQRIAIAFLACAVLFLKTNWKTQVSIGVGVLVVYWLIMSVLPLPHGQILEPGNNLAAFVDSKILTGHMWSATKTWDPEGLLSTFPAIVTGMIGMLAGQWLQSDRAPYEKVVGFFVVGNILIVLGLFWDMSFPINKALWTSSYVIYTGGIALNLLAILFWLLDIKKWRGSFWQPFQAFGMNAIFAYILAGVMAFVLGSTIQQPIFNTLKDLTGDAYLSSFMFALMFTALMFIPVWIMYKKKIFLKV